MDVTIIVPQYNQPALTIACLRTLFTAHQQSPRVIVVDDGSTGDSAASVRREVPNATVVCRPHQGVTAAWNHGARLAASEMLVFLNNDSESHGPWIDRLVAPLRVPNVLMTGVADRLEPAISKHNPGVAPPRLLEGWCFAMRREEFHALNGFDESLRLYFSDTDLQLRLWQRFGNRDRALRVVRGLPIRHAGHRTTRTVRERRSIWLRDRERFFEKWSAVDLRADR
jgi:GT2 family glycosyltransferase